MGTRPVPAPAMEGPRQVNIVLQNIAGEERAFVVPSPVHLGSGAPGTPSITLTNQTGQPARLWFPNGDQLFNAPAGYFSNPIDIPAGGLTLNLKANLLPSDYHYHVYCEAVGDCAQGDSEPRAICP